MLSRVDITELSCLERSLRLFQLALRQHSDFIVVVCSNHFATESPPQTPVPFPNRQHTRSKMANSQKHQQRQPIQQTSQVFSAFDSWGEVAHTKVCPFCFCVVYTTPPPPLHGIIFIKNHTGFALFLKKEKRDENFRGCIV